MKIPTDTRYTTLFLAKESFKFSVAHFTIFSASERERLHGHNYSVSAEIETPVGDNGLSSNYRVYKKSLKACCDKLDEYLLLPAYSPYLKIEPEGNQYRVEFNNEVMWFLQSDTLLLPILNVTVEELANYILETIVSKECLGQDILCDMISHVVRVSSGPGQSGSSVWLNPNNT